ncbi:MAG: hypothetical protein ACOYMY_06480 [Prochlorococcaceae cyanobacterium]|jgi:hypothetical protein
MGPGLLHVLHHTVLRRTGPLALLTMTLAGTASAQTPPAGSWQAIDSLRDQLEARGVRVVQDDCRRLPNTLGLYHPPSDRIVICRAHGDPAAVWDTLAHEATHRMQACRGGSITRPELQPAMARTLARTHPEELASLGAYPPRQRLAELEARYTAKLEPAQVLQLLQRYCG